MTLITRRIESAELADVELACLTEGLPEEGDVGYRQYADELQPVGKRAELGTDQLEFSDVQLIDTLRTLSDAGDHAGGDMGAYPGPGLSAPLLTRRELWLGWYGYDWSNRSVLPPGGSPKLSAPPRPTSAKPELDRLAHASPRSPTPPVMHLLSRFCPAAASTPPSESPSSSLS